MHKKIQIVKRNLVMKSFKLSKVVGVSVLVASLATLPSLPASAQAGKLTDSSNAGPGDIAIYESGKTDKGVRIFDWGWIGLLGLAGLAGRLAKHYKEVEPYREPDEMNRTVTPEEAVPYKHSNGMNHLDTYNYENEQAPDGMNATDEQSIKLYEERIIANTKRVKIGEIAVDKHVETESVQVSVPIEKERVVVERVTPADAGRAVDPGAVKFSEGEVARIETYEETADIHKETFVREEVKVKKVVDQETVEAQETLRREELDVDTHGGPVVDASKRNLT